jgi:hypothetical protein
VERLFLPCTLLQEIKITSYFGSDKFAKPITTRSEASLSLRSFWQIRAFILVDVKRGAAKQQHASGINKWDRSKR